jgi:parvulin-like peptidyl-prolyl isomerase
MIAMKTTLIGFGLTSVFLASTLCAQQGLPSGYQPYTPPVVGGLPPNSRGLEQPVFVADRLGELPEQAMQGPNRYDQSKGSPAGPVPPQPTIPTLNQMNQFAPGDLIATVGEERILVGDLVPPDKVTKELASSAQFELMLRQALVDRVTRMALAQRFVNDKVAGKPIKERDSARQQIVKQTNKIFFEKVVPMQKEKMKCTSDADFDTKLAEMGKSLTSLKAEFAESTWAQEHLRESVPEKPQIELSEMNDYYQDNIDQFRRPAKVRFQILTASFSRYADKQAAYQAIVDMGNQVRLGGARFDGVAKRSSTGLRASEGGQMDWTTQGALKSKVIDQAIFENPVGGLSQILEDADGYHIVEVLERTNADIQSFAEAQNEIRKTLIKQKTAKMRSDFIKKVRSETQVYTKWPSDIPNSLGLDQLLNN